MRCVLFMFFSLLFFKIYALPIQISLDKPIEEVDAAIYDRQIVEVRGFLYQNSEGQLVLANQPNLKSCCVGSQALIRQQIRVYGLMKPNLSVVTLQGIFHLSADSNNEIGSLPYYSLKEPKVVSVGNKGYLSRCRDYIMSIEFLKGLFL